MGTSTITIWHIIGARFWYLYFLVEARDKPEAIENSKLQTVNQGMVASVPQVLVFLRTQQSNKLEAKQRLTLDYSFLLSLILVILEIFIFILIDLSRSDVENCLPQDHDLQYEPIT